MPDLEKVHAGFYRCGRYCIHKGVEYWNAYDHATFVRSFRTLREAGAWARHHAEDSAETKGMSK